MMIKNENIRQGIFPRGQRLKRVHLDGFDAYVRGPAKGVVDNNHKY